MALYNSEKPVLCKVHGFCVAGGTDMALCADMLVIADDARIGYPPARVWGVPTTALWVQRVGMQRAKRLPLILLLLVTAGTGTIPKHPTKAETVTLYEAVLGGKVRVPTLEGAVEMAIPAGTNSGRVLRLKGKGMPAKSGAGDLYATVRIVLPEKADNDLEELMKKWRDGKPYDPRRDII